MNFRNGNYIIANLIENYCLIFHIENCSFVLNHYYKLAPDLNEHFLTLKFFTIFKIK